MVIVVFCLTPLQKNWLLLFFGSMFLTSALEWITGYVLKKVFHTSWWDYSNQPFNLSGYICLRFSILWGLGCVMVMDLIHPGITRFVRWIPTLAGQIIVGICLFCFACDFYVTVAGILKLNRRLKRLEEVSGLMHELSEDIGQRPGGGRAETGRNGGKAERILCSVERRSGTETRSVSRYDRSAAGAVSLDGRAEKAGFLGSIEEKKAHLAQLSEEYERIMQEKMPVRLLKAFPNARSE